MPRKKSTRKPMKRYLVRGKKKGKPIRRIVRTALTVTALKGAITTGRILSGVAVSSVRKLK